MTERSQKPSGRWVLWAIAAIGGLPWLLAWYLVDHPGLIGQSSHHGHLIQPLQAFNYEWFQPAAHLASPPLAEIRGRWVIIHFLPHDCDRACRQLIADTYKLHLLLNKDMPRVRRLVVWSEQALPTEELRGFLAQDKGLYFAILSPAFLEKQEGEIAKTLLQNGGVVVMDPLGNWLMWYDLKFDPYGLYRDLKRLLNVSHIG
ncbi:MAG: hypothetical protein N3A55_02685 [Methylohalobius sp.]|nr:hypothetical protein [Methylohalobius sp.]